MASRADDPQRLTCSPLGDRLATNYDVLFLRLLHEQRRLEHEQALVCLKAIDASPSPAPTAYQLVLRERLVDQALARITHVRVLAHFESNGQLVAHMPPEQAARGVSDEGPVLEPESTDRYYDLGIAGENLEGYHLGPLIRHGPCYSSYRGRGPTNERVRILTLSTRFEEHPQLLRAVTTELRAWHGFRHESGSGPLQLGRTSARQGRPAQLVVVYPESPGQSLDAFLAEHGPLPAEEALDLVLDVCTVLARAHSKGLRVGDVRSGNVIFDGERARLIDLGLSRANCIAAGHGRLGLPFGHPSCLAPEVLQEKIERPTAASDVYAMGILFYELICGQLPYRDQSPQAMLEHHLGTALPPPPPEVHFSSATAGVVLRMTAKLVEERAQDCAALVVALKEFRAGRPFKIPVGTPEASAGVGPTSHDEWTDISTRAATKAPARDWTESMIDRAPAVGPSDLEILASGNLMLSDPQMSGRLPPALLAKLMPSIPSALAAPPEPLPAETAPVEVEVEVEPPAESGPPVRIGAKLGRGAVGASYKGRFRGRAGEVAVKVISRKFSQHKEILDKILGDLREATQVKHQNVLAVLDVVDAEGRNVAICELSSGQTLRAVLDERGRLPVDEAMALIRDLASALEAGQSLGLGHGDIRAEKVYLEATRARLADFGHARGACLGAGLGKYGLFFGHPHYLAPEILQNRLERATPQSDLYALGVLFYEVVCGKRPFEEPGIKKNLLAHLKTPVPAPPSEVRLPPSLADVILRLLAKDPAERIGSVAELTRALDESLEASMTSAESVAGASAAGISAVHVEEFDPMASSIGNAARVEWGERSQVISQPREGWSKTKIKQAERVGPSWDAQATANELYADLEKADLAAVVLEAAKSAPKKTGRGGRGKKKEGSGKRTLLLAGAFVGLIGVMGAVIALRDDDKGGKSSGSTTPGGDGPLRPPPRDPQADEDRKKKELAEAERAIGEFERRGQSAFERDDFAELAKLPAEVFAQGQLSRPEVRKAIAELEKRVAQKAEARVAKDTTNFKAFVKAEDLGRAGRVLTKLKAWAPPTVDLSELIKTLDMARIAEESLFSPLADPKSKRGPERFERLLSRKLEGFQKTGRCYSNGGAVVLYKRAALLARDFRPLRGGKPSVGATPSGIPALALAGSRRTPAVVTWIPTLAMPVEVTLKVVPERGARVALVVGVDAKGRNGLGISTEGESVTLGMRGLAGASGAKVSEPIEFTLRCLKVGGGIQMDVRVVGKSTHNANQRLSPDRLRGSCGVVVQGKAWLVGFKVKALIDPGFK
jgi:serine/threonine protein kinase